LVSWMMEDGGSIDGWMDGRSMVVEEKEEKAN
jgi:hypothetical protein